jgi:CxxC motif-containing protein (DUF1111 family)
MKVKTKLFATSGILVGFGLMPVAWMQSPTEAPAGFDNLTNGHIAQADFDTNRGIFDEIKEIDEGLGPTFNMRGCGECHGNPVSGGISPVTNLRAGHFNGLRFIDHPGGSLIHSQAIDPAIQEHILDGNEVRTFRTSLNTLGDGFVEAVANQTFSAIRLAQPAVFQGTIVQVPVVEVPGALRVGRFGWKNQHASLLSFSGDEYLNQMGITNLVNGFTNFATENSSNGNVVPPCPPGTTGSCDPTADPEDDGHNVEAIAQFMRATKVPRRGPITLAVTIGETLFNQAACSVCHTRSITTAPPGTLINGGALRVSAALGNKVFHPFGDFMLHDVGTGDGIVQNGGQGTRNMVRTAPLWGVRTRNRLMHDGQSLSLNDAILRHAGIGGTNSANRYRNLSPANKANLIAFLKSL